MALARFYTFSKRRNSTKRPDITPTWQPEVLLKSPTDLNSPDLFVGSEEAADVINTYNYCVFEGRYYFIDSWTSERADLWTCHATLDTLATYKNYILNTTAFVAYSQIGGGNIVDTRLAQLAVPTTKVASGTLTKRSDAGTYILSCVGQQGIENAIINAGMMQQITSDIESWHKNKYVFDGDDIGTLIKAICDIGRDTITSQSAFANIRALTWLPWLVESGGGSGQITLGLYKTGIGYNEPAEPVMIDRCSITIPWVTGNPNDWRNTSRYTSIAVYMPFVGVVSLSPDVLIGTDTIDVIYAVHTLTGKLSVELLYNDGAILGTYGGDSGVSVPVGISNISLGSVVNSVLSSAGAIATQNPLGLLSAASGFQPHTTSIGGIGNPSGSKLNPDVFCMVTTALTNVSPSSVAGTIGLPDYSVKRLGSLSGYVKTVEASVDAPAGQSILQEINNYLNGGVFIE